MTSRGGRKDGLSLNHAPDWIGDETLYSWCARWHLMRGGGPPKPTGIALFGASHAYREHWAPATLAHFVERSGGRLGDARAILFERTRLVSYLAFAPITLREKVEWLFAAGQRTSWSGLLGMRACGLDPGDLMWCPDCVADDLDAIGIPSWHLPHQLPGSLVCLKHGGLLRREPNRCARWNLPPFDASGPSRRMNDHGPAQEAPRRLSLLAASLAGAPPLDRETMRIALVKSLRDQRVIASSRALSAEVLQRWFERTAIGTLSKTFAGLYPLAGGEWIHPLLRSRRAAHPLKWLVLWSAAFADQPAEAACRLMHSPSLLLAFDDDGQRLLWPELDPCVDQHVRHSVSSAATIREAAEGLGVSATAIRRYLRRAGCQMRTSRAAAAADARRTSAADDITGFMEATPDCTRSEVHSRCKAAVSWLRRWDPALLRSLLCSLPDKRDLQLALLT